MIPRGRLNDNMYDRMKWLPWKIVSGDNGDFVASYQAVRIKKLKYNKKCNIPPLNDIIIYHSHNAIMKSLQYTPDRYFLSLFSIKQK